MKKIRFYIILLALLTITIGVFAGRSKFQIGSLYASRDGITFCALTGNVTLANLTTTATGLQVEILNSAGITYRLYLYTGPGSYARLYSTLACF